MKKIMLMILSVVCISATAQEKTKGLDCYFAGSLSTTNGTNFNQSTYAGLELGVCAKNMMFGYASGRGNIDFSMPDASTNYWGEIKAYATKPVGDVKCFFVAGWGQYYGTTHSFVEYGAGFTYSVKKFDLGLTVSSWDNLVYVSPGITYNFHLGKK